MVRECYSLESTVITAASVGVGITAVGGVTGVYFLLAKSTKAASAALQGVGGAVVAVWFHKRIVFFIYNLCILFYLEFYIIDDNMLVIKNRNMLVVVFKKWWIIRLIVWNIFF